MERKRLTAKIAGLGEIANGRFVKKEGFESSYVLTNLGRKISRTRILGLLVEKFTSEDGNFGSITLDDGFETLRCKSFVDLGIFEGLIQGDLVDVIGKVRVYNEEIYVIPESIRKVDPNFESLRLLELKKIYDEQKKSIKTILELKGQAADANDLKILVKQAGLDKDVIDSILEAEEFLLVESEEKATKEGESREKVLKLIEELDGGGGAEYSEILEKSGLEENVVDNAIESLLESGACMEPKAGMIKKI